MNFELNSDQAEFTSFLGKIIAPFSMWSLGHRYEYSYDADRELEEARFYDVMSEDSLGSLAAGLMIHEVAKLPVCVETSASILVRPLACPAFKRPLAIIWGDETKPARFLPVARSVLIVKGEEIVGAKISDGDVTALDSTFAYPVGTLKHPGRVLTERIDTLSVSDLRNMWRLGIAAEIGGSLQAALDSVVEHVTVRRQFGRPLGAFQAIQHRLAECASLLQAARWLMLSAAESLDAEATAIAAGYAQSISAKIEYDLHQFMGAMGLTLEHPLHCWTYRTKLLRSELGGSTEQFAAAAKSRWISPQRKSAPKILELA